ncbi:SPFH domain-containing protein [Yinghuangia aomiensis]
MKALIILAVVVGVLAVLWLAMAIKIVKQYEQGVLFRFGRLVGPRPPGLRFVFPVADSLHRVSLRIVTMPIQSQGIITRDNVSVDVSAVAYFRVVDAVKSVVAIEKRRRGDQPDSPDDAAQGRRSAQPRRHPRRKPTASTWTSARSSTSPPRSGVSRSRSSSSRTSSCPRA